MRTPVLLLALLCSTAALADEIDLTPRARNSLRPPTLVVRAEGGNAYAPFGIVGGSISYLTDSLFAFELGAGGGFPGLQLGFAVRKLYGELGSYFVTELALAGNTRVKRGSDVSFGTPGVTNSSVWSTLGLGFEQRSGNLSVSVVGALAITTANFTPHFAIHGGIGYGF